MSEEDQKFAAWLRGVEIQTSIRKCQEIFDSGIFSSVGSKTPFFEPAVVVLLININDLLGKSKKDGMPIEFSDHVEQTEKIRHVHDLIRECRNAACHIGSGENLFEGFGKFSFNFVVGLDPAAFTIDDVVLSCEFEDDIAIYYGEKRIYLRRHLLASLISVAKNYPVANG